MLLWGCGMQRHFLLLAPCLFVATFVGAFVLFVGYGVTLVPGELINGSLSPTWASYNTNATDTKTSVLKSIYQFSHGYNDLTIGTFLFICGAAVVFCIIYAAVSWDDTSTKNK
jgi:hypothetical protein